jgi:hypothetical protein
VKDGSADGVTNMFAAACAAMANVRTVHLDIDGQFLYTMYVI